MAGTTEYPEVLVREPTGIGGLDEILGGGLFRAGIYVFTGSPGAGKTTVANQICFEHVRQGGRALYVTLLAETHGRMIAQLQQMRFFDPHAVGGAITYVNGFLALDQEGLGGLLKLLRGAIREQRATMLVLDGMVTASSLADSDVSYKRFINELQTWVSVFGCTVLFLTSAGPETTQPEHTMVDGIFELRMGRVGMRSLRELTVSKFRGSAFLEGAHPYAITGAGVVVYPRLEGRAPPAEADHKTFEQLCFDIDGFDRMLGGGVARSSTTLLLGSSGSGKTIMGLHFLAAGAARGEVGLHYGFYETPEVLRTKADRIGLDFTRHVEAGQLVLHWQPPAERILDALAVNLLDMVKRRGVRRLFIDGLVGFKEAAHPERIAGFFSALVRELGAMGVTTVITEETRELFVREIEVPIPGVSAIFDNIVFLRQVQAERELRRLVAVMKTRDSANDRTLYELNITERGIRIGAPFVRGLLGETGGGNPAPSPNGGR